MKRIPTASDQPHAQLHAHALHPPAFLALSLFVLLAALGCPLSAAGQDQRYEIRLGSNHAVYALRKVADEKYFRNNINPDSTTKIHKYTVEGAPLPDSEAARSEIMRSLATSFVNPRAARVQPDKAVRLKKKGYCVPSALLADGSPGPTFAIDFLPEKGTIKGFVVGSSFPCAHMETAP